jgi:DnaJ-class molecular chaperone
MKCKKKAEICKHCRGTGEEPHSRNKEYEGLSCIHCRGTGEEPHSRNEMKNEGIQGRENSR